MLKLLIVLHAALAGQAQEADAPKRPRWLDLAQAHMRECAVFPTAERARAFKIEPEPVFHHVQSVRGNAVGSVFVCLEASGRPAAVGDVFFLPAGKDQHRLYSEWHSLAPVPITIEWNSAVQMACETGGLDWRPVPGADPPAEEQQQRERQLRRLARRFTAHLVNREQDKYELRLLTTPLYQYHARGEADFATGGLFAFCQETDPELFLVVEARRDGGELKWMYAPAEFSNLNLFLKLDGTEVWSASPPRFDPRGPHVASPAHRVVLPPETPQGQ
jgi:hypothetical protein